MGTEESGEGYDNKKQNPVIKYSDGNYPDYNDFNCRPGCKIWIGRKLLAFHRNHVSG